MQESRRLVFRNENSWNDLIMWFLQCGKSKRALDLYQKMQGKHSVQPTERTFVALLKACTKHKDVKSGGALHATVSKLGLLESNVFIGATLVDMYAKCGLLSKARQVLDKLPVRDVVSWNALISGYTEHEYNEEAMECYEYLQLEGLSPNAVTIVSGLKACSGLKAIDKGREIHAESARKGLSEASIFVGNSLVDMYSRCGFLHKAEEVYNGLPVKDVVSCNSMIVGYTDHGDGDDALTHFKRMESEGIVPNNVTYICCLNASATANDTNTGRDIHAEVARQGWLGKDIALGNALIDMYAKWGMLARAQEVFDKLPFRDVVSFNALITGCAECGHGEEAFKCFEQMKKELVTPDTITFICSLKACGSAELIEEGQVIHAEIIKLGLLEGDLGVANSLIDLYSKCGWCAEAQDIFDKLPTRDIVSWNSLMGGYIEHGYNEEGLECFDQMQLQGIFPDAVTFVGVVQACSGVRSLYKGEEVHAEILRKGMFEDDPFIGSALVDMYVKCGAPANAQEVFDKLSNRDTVTWNALMDGYVENEFGHEALQCFERMLLQGIPSDGVTLLCILKACGIVGARDKGHKIHAEIVERGLFLGGNIIIGNTLVDTYARCGMLLDAQKVLDKLEVRGVISWNALIAGYAQVGDCEKVFLNLEKMMEDDVKPNAITFTCILKACSHAALFEKGKTIYDDVIDVHGIARTPELMNCMVDLLCRAGQLEEAIALTQRVPTDNFNLVAWVSVLSACRRWGSVELGMQAFESFLQVNADDAGAYIPMSHIFASTGNDEV